MWHHQTKLGMGMTVVSSIKRLGVHVDTAVYARARSNHWDWRLVIVGIISGVLWVTVAIDDDAGASGHHCCCR